MGSRICILILALFTRSLGIPALADNQSPLSTPVRDKWALVVGVGKFTDKKIPQLKYASKDARDFRNFLVNEAQFSPDHVRLLLDEKATQRRVLSELGNKFLARVAKPDDLVVIYFSSHGSPSSADIRGKSFVVAHDSDPDDLFTTGIEMDKILQSIDSRVLSKRVLLVLDACHSGVASEGAKGISRAGNFDAEQLAQGSGQLVITSSSPEQVSFESKRYENGIFTRKLLEGLRIHGKKTTLAEAFSFISNSVSAESQEDYAARQTPVLKSKWNGNELVLAVSPAAPQSLPQSVRAILEADSTVGNQVPARKDASDDLKYTKALAMLNKGDYASCIELLLPLSKSKTANTADLQFNLANAYAKLNKTADALFHYKESFRLNPHGKKADYCLQMINYYSKSAGEPRRLNGRVQVQHSSSSYASLQNVPAQTRAKSPGSANSADSISDDLHDKLKQVRGSLPRIITAKRVTPLLGEVMSWSLQERANYSAEASQRVERANIQVQDGDTLLKKAESLSYTLVPNSRSYGETDESFSARKAQGESLLKELLLPYRAEIELRTKLLQDETAILQACEAAARELSQNTLYIPRTNTGKTTTNCK